MDSIKNQLGARMNASAYGLNVTLDDLALGANMTLPAIFPNSFAAAWNGSAARFLRNLTVSIAADLGVPPRRVALAAILAAASGGRRSLLQSAPTGVAITCVPAAGDRRRRRHCHP